MVHYIEENQINEEIVKNSHKLIIIDFFAEWCIPCQMLTPVLKELDKKYAELEIYKINIEEATNATILYGINSVPTLLFFKDSEEVERIIGLESLERLSKVIEGFI